VNKYRFAGGKAIVTGAASGIGEALVRDLGARGSNLVLLDRDVAGLTRVSEDLRTKHPGIAVTTVIADLSDRANTDVVSAQLAIDHPDTTLLINCAGVALSGTFDKVSLQDVNWLLDINFRATVTLTHHLLPVLRNNQGSHLANVSSVFGLFAPPGEAAYVSSKFAVRGFTEALRSESQDTHMGVTSIHPGGIKTAIATNARIGTGLSSSEAQKGQDKISRWLNISASDAAESILHGIERRKPRVLIGLSARIPDLIARVAPGNYMKIIRHLV
jgi:short-subunit dehydrogenase